MDENLALGYTGALVAVFFFGTCYVPAKQYPTYGASPCASCVADLVLTRYL